MTTSVPLSGRSLQAALTVKDLDKSVAWYVDVVGFAIDRKIDRGGALRAVAVRAGDVRLLLNLDDGAKGWNRAKGEGISLQIAVAQDVDALARRIKERGGVLLTEPTDMPWGARIIRAADPDGFRLTFSASTA